MIKELEKFKCRLGVVEYDVDRSGVVNITNVELESPEGGFYAAELLIREFTDFIIKKYKKMVKINISIRNVNTARHIVMALLTEGFYISGDFSLIRYIYRK